MISVRLKNKKIQKKDKKRSREIVKHTILRISKIIITVNSKSNCALKRKPTQRLEKEKPMLYRVVDALETPSS